MSLASESQKRPRNDDDRILPLINVVFLLLIFFMIAGHLTATDPFAVTPPHSATETTPDADSHLILIDRNGRLALDGRPLPEAAVLAAFGSGPANMVRIKADGAVDAVTVIALMERLRAAGLSELQLLTVPAAE
ncbi:MAG: biopolymer transporter ExbD [Minwuia sp.]|nr:biopolymer transporter ExbD [Minwuia sp.]